MLGEAIFYTTGGPPVLIISYILQKPILATAGIFHRRQNFTLRLYVPLSCYPRLNVTSLISLNMIQDRHGEFSFPSSRIEHRNYLLNKIMNRDFMKRRTIYVIPQKTKKGLIQLEIMNVFFFFVFCFLCFFYVCQNDNARFMCVSRILQK